MENLDHGVIAVVDIGKTNAKLTLTHASSGEILWSAERANTPLQRGPVRELGVEATWNWLQDCFAHAPDRERIRAIVPVAHGAAVMLLDGAGDLVCAPDYEDPIFDEVAEEYSRLRDPFADTMSPAAARGLNVGRQLFFLQTRAPALFASVAHIVTHPQYWSWKLSGVLASDLTSLGAHTDMWLPARACFSPLAVARGWASMVPAPRGASETLGALLPELARRLGLDPACRVTCGIHDSNASFLCHRAARGDAPFAVVSSGTWAIVMASGTDLGLLREARDMLANVDAFGTPVGTARFMSGREYATIAGSSGGLPDIALVAGLVRGGVMALPTFAMAGPFPGRHGTLVAADGLSDAELATLASLYVALVIDQMLDLLGARGDVIIDGPLAQNDVYAAVMADLRDGPVLASTARAGTLAGARRLVRGPAEPPPKLRTIGPPRVPGIAAYREAWRRAVREPGL